MSRFYITKPHPCSYLAREDAQTMFVDPTIALNLQEFSHLSRQGFRRSGDYIYKPACRNCAQCISCRVPVHQHQPSSITKKAIKKNNDLVKCISLTFNAKREHYLLYEKYINARHFEGDMYPASVDQFEKFIIDSSQDSFFIEYRLNNTLVCVNVCDLLDDGISAVYTFFDPQLDKRSLGTYSITQQLALTQMLHLSFLYLGYWVPNSPKMAYKANYVPLEILVENKWYQLKDTPDDYLVQQLLSCLQ